MTATQLSLDLFTTTVLSEGLTLDHHMTSVPPRDDSEETASVPALPDTLTRGVQPHRADRNFAAGNFRLAGDRPLARSWRGRAEDNIAAIRLMKRIAREGRGATQKEQAALIRFIGFGATDLATTCFRRPGENRFKSGWEELGTELQSIVTEAEYAGLARTTQYAHYTPETVVRPVWAGLERLGFTGGRVLEPGIGTGLFVALMPETMQDGAAVTGIEFDAISAGISRLLYPAATIRHEDFTRARLSGQYDLAIGNPPYSDRVVRANPAYRALALRLHDFFIAKAIDSLRPGGLAAFVTSTGTMDKLDAGARAYIARSADLLGAIRIPEGSFRTTAGTDVVVDLLFFRKREEDAPVGGAAWETTMPIPDWPADPEPVAINRYWIEHSEMVLGAHALRRGFHGPGQAYTCQPPPGADLAEALATAIRHLPQGLYVPRTANHADGESAEFVAPSSVGTAAERALLKEGSFYVGQGGAIMQIVDGRPNTVPVRTAGAHSGLLPKQARILRALIPIRDAVRQVLRTQAEDEPWQDAQRRLRIAYTSFVRSFGPLNATKVIELRNPRTGEVTESHRRPNLQPFLNDPDCWLVSSIEDYDLETRRGRMGPIFSERVIAPPAAPVVVTAADALAVCLNETGRVDPAVMADMLDRTEEDVLAELGDAVFRNPETGAWETADAYLSGPVRTRLAVAEASAALDPGYARNVSALRAVQPEDLKPSEITARLGAPWIPAEAIETFAAEILTAATHIRHHAEVAAWSVDTLPFRGTAAGTAEWGTSRRNAGELLEDALNARTPQIYDTLREDGTDKRVLNTEATEAAKEKLAKVRLAFERWVWTDPDRTDRLARIYNDRFNNLVTRHFDGRHLTLAGASPLIRLRERLVRLGVPRSEIAIMQDFSRSAAKQRAINEFNAGHYRILIGSSDTMGTGVNGQRRLKALHHLDVPWIPSKIEQREGRIERQGNENDEIEIYAYATLGSMDATMWQNNERKARFIAAVLRGDRSVRRLEDLETGQASQFALAKALASGDQRLMQKAGLEGEVARLERLRAAHFDDQHAIRRSIAQARAAIAGAGERIAHIEADIATRTPREPFGMEVAGRSFGHPMGAGTALLIELRKLVTRRHCSDAPIAQYRGFRVLFVGGRSFSGKFGYDVMIQRRHGRQRLEINLATRPDETVAQLNDVLDRFEAEIVAAHRTVVDQKERLRQFEVRPLGPFPMEAELAAKQAELDAIDADLAASSQSPAASAPFLDEAA